MNYKEIFKKFRSNDYFVNLHYMPLHLSPYFRKKGFKEGDFKNAEEYASSAISIPIFNGLRDTEILKISNFIKSFFK